MVKKMERSRFKQLKQRSIEIFNTNRYECGDILLHQASPDTYSSLFAWDSDWNIIALSNINPKKIIEMD